MTLMIYKDVSCQLVHFSLSTYVDDSLRMKFNAVIAADARNRSLKRNKQIPAKAQLHFVLNN